eukprot:SAG22_NODE_945_length_6374_cov_5.969562_5_plen_288_part_00
MGPQCNCKSVRALFSFAPTAAGPQARLPPILEAYTKRLANANLEPASHATYLRLHLLRRDQLPATLAQQLVVAAELAELPPQEAAARLAAFQRQTVGRHAAAGEQPAAQANGCTVYVHGNLAQEQAVQFAQVVVGASYGLPAEAGWPDGQHRWPDGAAAASAAAANSQRIHRLEAGKPLLHCATAINAEEKNSSMELYFQVGTELVLPADPAGAAEGGTVVGGAAAWDVVRECTIDLLCALLAEPFFDTLRTKEQLGAACLQKHQDVVLVLHSLHGIVSDQTFAGRQ